MVGLKKLKKAIAEARIANPDDTSWLLTEANLYWNESFVR
jgi:hypothetical protein